MNPQENRLKILKYLYEKDEQRPRSYIGKEELITTLGLDSTSTDSAVLYLEEKGYIKLLKSLGALFNSAQITAYGKDLVEDEPSLRKQFPAVQFIIQNGHINVSNQNSDNNQVHINSEYSFEQIYNEIEKLENKEIVKEEVKKIEEESKKESGKIDYGVIKKSWEFIKKNAGTIIPLLEPIIKRIFGL